MKVTKFEQIKLQRKDRVAFYCRVSSKSDAQENSFEHQVEYFNRYQQMHPEYDYVGIYADRGVSGRLNQQKRDGFYSMMADAKKGSFDRIIVKSISRFSRNTVLGIKALSDLEKLGISVHFENNGIDTKLMDKGVLLTTLNFMAEKESIKISESCIWGFRKRFAKGIYNHSTAPYGFDIIDNGKLIPNEEQALILIKMYDLILQGHSATSLAKYLNELNIPTLKGGEWKHNVVIRILRNERNIGDMLLQKQFSANNGENKRVINKSIIESYYVTDTHQPIIDREIFAKVNEILDANTNKYTNVDEKKIKYPLTSKIMCENCYSNFKRRVLAKGKPYESIKWGCSKYIESAKNCSCKLIKENDLYDIIKIMLLEIKENDELKFYIDELIDNSELLQNEEYRKLVDKHIQIKKQKSILELQSSMSTSAFILEKLNTIKNDEEKLLVEMNKYEDSVAQYKSGKSQEIRDYLNYNEIDNVFEIEEFITMFIKKIYVNNEIVEIKLKGEYRKRYLR